MFLKIMVWKVLLIWDFMVILLHVFLCMWTSWN